MEPVAATLAHASYAGLALGLVLSTLGLFSSEVLLLVGGWAIRQGSLNAVLVVIIALIAQLVGATISYFIGRYGGQRLLARYGRYLLISQRDLERAHRWFQRYGRGATLLGYCLPLLRGYIGYAGGLVAESERNFFTSATAGIAIWSVALLALGYALANHLTRVEQVLKPFSYILAVLVVVAVAAFIIHRWREARA